MAGPTFSDDELATAVQRHPTFGDYKLAGELVGHEATEQEKRRVASQLFRWRRRSGVSTSRPPDLHVVTGGNDDVPPPAEDAGPVEQLRQDIQWLRRQMQIAATDRSHTAVTGQMALIRKMEADLAGLIASAGHVDVQEVSPERLRALVERLPRSLVREVVGE